LKVGLTGDIGSGKSTVLALFGAQGFHALSADQVVHDLLRDDHQLIHGICEGFGMDLRDANGAIDRKKLGALVFGKAELRLKLEALVHPRVREVWEGFIQVHVHEDVIVEIPLLFEKKLETSFDRSVTVYSSLEVKTERLKERGMDEVAIRARLNAQLDQESKADRSDFLILNNGSIEFLRKQVAGCIRQMKQS